MKQSEVKDALNDLLNAFKGLVEQIVKICKVKHVEHIDRCEVVGGNSNWKLFKNKLLECFEKHDILISLSTFEILVCLHSTQSRLMRR